MEGEAWNWIGCRVAEGYGPRASYTSSLWPGGPCGGGMEMLSREMTMMLGCRWL